MILYTYLFIFWKNKYIPSGNAISLNEHSNNEIILKKDEFLISNSSILSNSTCELKNIKSYLKGDGSDQHWKQEEMDINIFIQNKKKLGILYILLSNLTSTPKKLSIISSFYQSENKNITGPNLFAGGFFKDSDFNFSDFF